MRNILLGAALALSLAACGGGDDAGDAVDDAAEAASEAAEATTEAVTETAEAAGEAVSDAADAAAETVDNALDEVTGDTYAEACVELGGDASTCGCIDGVYKAELNDDLYEIITLSSTGKTDEATAKSTAYITANPTAAAEMGEALSAATEKAAAQCGG